MKKAIYKMMSALVMSHSRPSRKQSASGIFLKIEKDSGQAGMTNIRLNAVLRMISVSVLFLIFMSYAAQAQAEIQDTASVKNKIETEARKGRYQLITPEELKKEYLKDSATFLLVDVRQEWSYQMQHIRGALHIDFAPTWWNQYSPVMRSDMKKLLGPDKDKEFVFY